MSVQVTNTNKIKTKMIYLSAVIGLSSILWIAIGIVTHAKWTQNVFVQESLKIKNQNAIIKKYGYSAISASRNLQSKKGFVFGYWDENNQTDGLDITSAKSPVIFDLVNVSLIAFTSTAILIILSKGTFASLGMSY